MRAATRGGALAILCGAPVLLLAALAGTGTLGALTVRAPAADALPAAELGIGELEMGPGFGRPTATPARGPVATVLLYGVLLLCPGKFVLLWALHRQESRFAWPAGERGKRG